MTVPLALLKQQGVGVKGMAKSVPVNEEVPPLIEGGGKIEVICLHLHLLSKLSLVPISVMCPRLI